VWLGSLLVVTMYGMARLPAGCYPNWYGWVACWLLPGLVWMGCLLVVNILELLGCLLAVMVWLGCLLVVILWLGCLQVALVWLGCLLVVMAWLGCLLVVTRFFVAGLSANCPQVYYGWLACWL